MTVPEEQLIDSIYAAALDPHLWSAVLPKLGEAVGGDATALTHLDIVTGEGTAIAINNAERTLSDYFDYYYKINPLQLVADPGSYIADWAPTIRRDEECFAREKLETSEYYNDFLRPIQAEWGIILRLGLSGHDVTTISIGRSDRAGRFEDAEIANAARIHPHLIRATALSKRFADVYRRADGLAAAVDQSRSAMMLVDGEGALLHGNAAAERMLGAGDLLCVRNGLLTAVDPAGARSLATAIHAASDPQRERRMAGTFAVRRSGDALPINGAVMPLLNEHTSVFERKVATLVSMAGPLLDASSGRVAIDAAFGLTAAERGLATDLLRGMDLRSSATRRGTSINTVRTQLASIFAKTGTHRQVDLVQLLTLVDVTPYDI